MSVSAGGCRGCWCDCDLWLAIYNHSPFFVLLSSVHDIAWRCLQLYAAAAPVDRMEMRLSGPGPATTFIFLGAVSVPSATCNDARFLPESHILKQYTPSDCWGHEVDCTKTATPAAHVDCSYATNTSFHLVGVKSASEVFFSQADFGYLGEFVSSLQNYCRPETQFDSSLTCTANLQFCSGVKLSTSQSQLVISFYYKKEVHTSPLPYI